MNKLLNFLFLNFGPLIGFYAINILWGFKVGILVSMVLVFVEFFWTKWKKKKNTFFFYFSSAVILFFGGIDLCFLNLPYLMKYEAPLTNFMFAIVFGMSLFKEKSIIQEFAEAQGRTSTRPTIDQLYFFEFLTTMWTFYFLTKSVFYLCLSFYLPLEHSLLVRAVVGKISFWVMMLFSVVFPSQIWRLMEKFRLFPTQRTKKVIQQEAQ